jgi:hypothetical protein
MVYRFASRRWIRTQAAWVANPLAGLAAGAGLAWWLTGTHFLPLLLTAEWWVIGGAGTLLLVHAYDRVHPGARLVGWLVLFTGALIFIAYLAPAAAAAGRPLDPVAQVEYAAFWTMQLLFATLRAVWRGVLFFGLLAAGLGALLTTRPVRREKDGQRAARLACDRAALRTGRLALALTIILFLGITLVLWSGIFTASVSYLDAFHCREAKANPLPGPASWLIPSVAPDGAITATGGTGGGCPELAGRNVLTVQQYVVRLLAESAGPALPIALVLVGLAFGLLAWMALPSVLLESADTAPAESTNEDAQRSGAWLSRGLDSTRLVTHVLWVASFVLPVLAWIASRFAPHSLDSLERVTVELISGVGLLVTTTAVVVFAMLAKVGGSVLDVILDVDNYLRTHPRSRTPRARIVERYVSTLRYLLQERTPEGEPAYDAVVIVAHSLGALISCDLLRFLVDEARGTSAEPGLGALGYGPDAGTVAAVVPMYLFTMGNPARQLLSRFFPHRYEWVRAEPDNGTRPLSALTPTVPDGWDEFPSDLTPQPESLGVAEWRNAYRSGDYVGRSLWVNEWYGRSIEDSPRRGRSEPLYVAAHDGPHGWAEMCIGLGAHTHYWDRTAPDIARQLDQLVQRAPRRAPRIATAAHGS